jgi:hypothetical protein
MKNRAVLLFTLTLASGSAIAQQTGGYDQPYDGTSSGVTSQKFTGASSLSTYAYDDFTVPDGQYWNVDTIYIRGRETGNAAATTRWSIRISDAPGTTSQTLSQFNSGPNPPFIGEDIVAVVAGDLVLLPGTYWLSAWVERPASGGQWLWKQTTPVRGSQGYIHNPGGGMGFGTTPIALGNLPDANGPRDLAFSIAYGTLPEPAALVTLALGITGLALRRRR